MITQWFSRNVFQPLLGWFFETRICMIYNNHFIYKPLVNFRLFSYDVSIRIVYNVLIYLSNESKITSIGCA